MYFATTDLSGPAALSQCEAVLDHAWPGQPFPGVPADFSARWTSTRNLAGGATTFTTLSDDGIRVSVDGTTILSNWTNHARTTDVATVNLASGNHLVVVEYLDSYDFAAARLTIAPDAVADGTAGRRGR